MDEISVISSLPSESTDEMIIDIYQHLRKVSIEKEKKRLAKAKNSCRIIQSFSMNALDTNKKKKDFIDLWNVSISTVNSDDILEITSGLFEYNNLFFNNYY